jgi:cytoskeletal protein RodZ
MSEISYQPKKDYKKYIFISLAVIFSLGVIIFLVLTARQEKPADKNSNDSANGQESDKKVLSPEEIQEALTKKTEGTEGNQDSAISETQIGDALKKEAPQRDETQEVAPQEDKPLSPEEIQASLNKRL